MAPASTNYDVVPVLHNSQNSAGTTAFMTTVTGAGTDAIAAGTKYLANPGEVHAAAAVKLFLASAACTAQNLYASMETAPAGTDTSIFTVVQSVDNGATWTDTTLTVTITGTAKAGSDATHKVAVAAGTLLGVKEVTTGSVGAKCTATFQVA